MSLSFEEKLKNYAEVFVQIGINVQPDQRLVIIAHRDAGQFVHEVARAAYRAGAVFVDTVWQDDELTLIQLTEGPDREDNVLSPQLSDVIKHYVENGDAYCSIRTTTPGIFDNVPLERMKIYQQVRGRFSNELYRLQGQHHNNVTTTNVPTLAWATKVFPDLSPGEALNRLWDAVFKTVRADLDDPVAAWEEHMTRLSTRGEYLTNKKYDALRYKAPGTDLTIGLPPNHIWRTASEVSPKGVRCTVNIPTEEVYTLPHRERVDGVVRSTMPLNANGIMIDDFSVTFENGRVVGVKASVGEDHLRNIIETDDSAARLGEVALVPHSSPISQMGFTFYHILYDENASCHIALGFAYRNTLEGGQEMDDGAFNAVGGNTSLVHTDFMIGSDEMDIDGVLPDGTREPLIRGGEWAFDV